MKISFYAYIREILYKVSYKDKYKYRFCKRNIENRVYIN